MKILLASEYFFPVSKGGTEMYVYQLAKELIANGHECSILSLSNTESELIYEGLTIYYIPFEKEIAFESEQPQNLNSLLSIVNQFKPEVFHLHTITPSLSIYHLSAIKNLGVAIFFTSHLSTFTCIRGDLLLEGKEVCDGYIERLRCMNCFLDSKGYKNPFLKSIITQFSKLDFTHQLNSALSVYDNKIDVLDQFKNDIDELVVVSNWQKEILLLNGFNSSNVSICRQAVFENSQIEKKAFKESEKVKIGFIGRVVEIKGLHLLLSAIQKAESNKFQLNIAAVKGIGEDKYFDEMKSQAISLNANWVENLDASEINIFLDEIDLLVVPTVCLESGPYVIYEAMARKVPVVSFNRGGASELIRNEVDGWLLDEVEELNLLIKKLPEKREVIRSYSQNISTARLTHNLFEDMIRLYSKYENSNNS